MKDELCLIPYSELEADRTYTNVSEYFLRGNRAVFALLSSRGADGSIVSGECSDFELFSAFLELCRLEPWDEIPVLKAFVRTLEKLSERDEALFLDAESLWRMTSDSLMDNKLRSAIASSGLEELGVPILPGEYFDGHFVSIRGVRLHPVFCPFGTETVSLDKIGTGESLDDACAAIRLGIEESHSCAVFFGGYTFEKPNEYSARLAYEKCRMGQKLSCKENDLLRSQLLRMTALASAERGKELKVFLPYAPDVKAMGAAAELLQYVDPFLSDRKLCVTVYGGDAVSLCMAETMAAIRYKNITAVTGICGGGSDRPDVSAARYWGCGADAFERYASLSRSPALSADR